MREVVKADMGLKSRVVASVQSLTPLQMRKRFERAKKMLNWVKNHSSSRLVFSDEKNFTCDAYHDKNKRFIANKVEDVDPSVRYVPKSKHPAKAMMLGVVCSDGHKLPPIWVKGNLNWHQYEQLLSTKVFPALDQHYGAREYTFMQDGAPCHMSVVTQAYLKSRLGSRGFWSKKMWSPSSPNLNPLDYHIWQHIEKKACATSHSNVANLKTSVDREWNSMSVSNLKKACRASRGRLEACIAANGAIFEK